MLCRRQRFRACGRVRSLNRRGQRPLVSADSFGFLFVATGDESLTPQRAFRSLSLRFRLPPSADSPLARRRPLHSFAAPYRLLRKGTCHIISPVTFTLPSIRRVRRFPKGDRKALWSPPQRRNPPVGATAPTPKNPSMTHAEYCGVVAPLPRAAYRPREAKLARRPCNARASN